VEHNKIETARLLVVSRDSTLLTPLWSAGDSNAWHIETAISAWDAAERIQSGPVPHILVLDLPRGDDDGPHILRSLHRIHPGLSILVVCCPEDADRNEEVIELGAQEVLIKPVDGAHLEWVIQGYLTSPLDRDRENVAANIEQVGPDLFFVSAGPVSQKIRTQVQLLAAADVPVLILGEPGSGKDTVARLIHKLSTRSRFEFLKVNCANKTAEQLEAELFGTRFSGNGRIGTSLLERADKGTLFFDEITEMPLSIQNRLTHILQHKKANTAERSPIDFRILAATSANTERAMAEQTLREDLYYRLSAFSVQVPSLWQRRSEIGVLMQHMMQRLARQYGLPGRTFSAKALNACRGYSWPGNFKELESFVKRYLVVGEKDMDFNGFRPDLVKSDREYAHAVDARMTSGPQNLREHREHDDGEREIIPKSLKSLVEIVKSEAERNAIGVALQKTGWNRKAAARLLQVSYRTLLYKIEQYHMSASEPILPSIPEKTSFQSAGVKGTDKNGRAAS